MEAYINGTACISPQNTFGQDKFPDAIINHNTEYLSIIPPDYKNIIPPLKLRRMSKIIRMGVGCGLQSLKDANIDTPGGIITGTGLGCAQDTEKFLSSMLENNEEMLSPTPFIQSTHNTISAQIALLIGSHEHNFTHVQRGFSFENSLLDALMMLAGKEANNVLLGGLDEITPNHYKVTKHLGIWKNNAVDIRNLINDKQKGSIPGEGAAFFTIANKKTPNTYCKICGLKSFYKPETNALSVKTIIDYLSKKDFQPDLMILGNNGDPEGDAVYYDLMDSIPCSGSVFKPFSGEYYTASAFALWMASILLKNKHIAEASLIKKTGNNKLKKVMIYNHYRNSNHSIMLVSAK